MKLDAATSAAVLAEIQARASAAGLLEPPSVHYGIRAGLLAPPLGGLLLVAWTYEATGIALLAAAAAGVLCIQLGFIAHDAGHGAVARSRRGNAIAGHLCFSVLNGLGFDSWRATHGAHHAGCQDESRDPDMSVDFVLSLTRRSAAAKTGVWKRLLPYQAAYLWPLALLFAHSLRAQSLSQCYGQPSRYLADAVLLPAHYAL